MENTHYELAIRLNPAQLPSNLYMSISDNSIHLLSATSFPFNYLINDLSGEKVFEFIGPSLFHIFRGTHLNIFTYTELSKTYSLLQHPPAVSLLFSSIFSSENRENFTYSCSFFQISDENLTDLLQSPNRPQNLKIKKDLNNSVIIENVSEYVVSKQSDAEFLLNQGLASQLLQSSDSTLVFQFYLESRKANPKGLFLKSKLSIIDLPSSGQSLKAFKSCLQCLEAKCSVPYKDSKLTQILSDSLTLFSKNLLISTISPFESEAEQTLTTLNTTLNISSIQVTPQKNLSNLNLKSDFSSEISKLKSVIKSKNNCEELWKVKEKSDQLKTQISKKTTIEEVEDLIKENKDLRNELQQLIGRPLAENDLEHPESFQDALVLTEDLIKRRKLDLASVEMKEKLQKEGRCLICTLKQPCRHSNLEALAIYKPKPKVLEIGFEDENTFLTGTDMEGPKKFRIRSSRGKLEVHEKISQDKTEQMIREAQKRLKILNKIEVYREEKLRKEIEKIEVDAQTEKNEQEKKKKDQEKQKKYFDVQKQKLLEYSLKKQEEAKKKKERPVSQRVRKRPYQQEIKIRDYENRRFQVFEILRQQSKMMNSIKNYREPVRDDSLDLLNIEDF